ncbi:MAG: NAD(P)-dependent glycerol-3-phosphate dehydrogenase [Candidatus Margulisbacteria bacterium]|nr:NAD(P)-dependent glycerol-3-phosphate dehydrogenase [Candidatus Margulisiibacteriota bacterium]
MVAKIGIIGSGAWGLTLGKLLFQNNHDVIVWCHNDKVKKEISEKHTLKSFFSSMTLPGEIKATTNLAEAVEQAGFIVLVVASHFYRKMAKELKPLLKAEQIIVSATKGLEEDNLKRMSEVAVEELGGEILERFVVLSGPNLSKEIINNHPAAAVVAGKNIKQAEKVQNIFSSKIFRVYTSTDIVGVELGGTLKNVIAIAAGIADGLKFGNNSKAALMVRGAAEIVRLSIALGSQPITLMGLSGMGDLIATCTSNYSRNHQVGEKLAKGKSLKQILKSMKAVAEGIKTSKAVYKLAQQKNIEMPIVEQVYKVLYEEKSPQQAINDLMTRDPKAEHS